ncbi:MAG: hypothetical protein EOR00_27290 [Mesorhizobium sp.]|nr:MAG: hypothetical protein EOR00_27290 [Mesorhizobium sp.]
MNGETKKLGIALSGGGFRAAAFHVGTFTALQELDLLDKLDLISCVSGGSVAGAYLALNWGKQDVLKGLSDYLLTKSIAVSSIIGGILDPSKHAWRSLAQATIGICSRVHGYPLSEMVHESISTPPTWPPATCFSLLQARHWRPEKTLEKRWGSTRAAPRMRVTIQSAWPWQHPRLSRPCFPRYGSMPTSIPIP